MHEIVYVPGVPLSRWATRQKAKIAPLDGQVSMKSTSFSMKSIVLGLFWFYSGLKSTVFSIKSPKPLEIESILG